MYNVLAVPGCSNRMMYLSDVFVCSYTKHLRAKLCSHQKRTYMYIHVASDSSYVCFCLDSVIADPLVTHVRTCTRTCRVRWPKSKDSGVCGVVGGRRLSPCCIGGSSQASVTQEPAPIGQLTEWLAETHHRHGQ